MSDNKPLTYISYLKLEELLQLQSPLSDGPEHDELLFIVIHQVYELWFKQVLHELDALSEALDEQDAARALAALKRVLTIFKTLVSQVDILETMTPMSFNSFRTRLAASSGFQSAQFRELEFRLGHKRPALINNYPEDSSEYQRLSVALQRPSVWLGLLGYLKAQGYTIPDQAFNRPAEAPIEPDEAVQRALVEAYQAGGFGMQICERLVDLDEGLQEWRYRHVKMVERTIGSKPGTGGSMGAQYLRSTLFTPLFPDLWAIRAQL